MADLQPGRDDERPEFPQSEVDVPRVHRGTVYAAIAARRIAFDTLMWQVPALALTAQAFLLTIAYGGGSPTSQRVAGSLAVLVAFVAFQTLSKHRANEETDSLMLEAMEEAWGIQVGWSPLGSSHPHSQPSKRGPAVGNDVFHGWLIQRKSYNLWRILLVVFALAGAFAVYRSI